MEKTKRPFIPCFQPETLHSCAVPAPWFTLSFPYSILLFSHLRIGSSPFIVPSYLLS